MQTIMASHSVWQQFEIRKGSRNSSEVGNVSSVEEWEWSAKAVVRQRQLSKVLKDEEVFSS